MQITVSLIVILIQLNVISRAQNFREDFFEGFNTLARDGIETVKLQEALQGVQFPYLFRGKYKLKEKDDPALACAICNDALDIMISTIRDGVDKSKVVDALLYMCVNLQLESEDICKGLISNNVDTYIYIITDSKSKVTSERICSMALQHLKCVDNSSIPWSVEIPPLEEGPVHDDFVNTDSQYKQTKVLQLTDIHYDPTYKVGSNADCTDPLCCQAGTEPASAKAAAGYWGDYRVCDSPWHTIIDALDHIINQHDHIDYVYFTGDIVSHKMWTTSISSNKEIITKVYKQLKKTFGNVPIFPILGNHEPHPVNQFSYEAKNSHEVSTKWVFELAAEQWMEWLPEETQETILKGGYYTVKIEGGPRIIALNSNVCFTYNTWLFYDDIDPFEQLQWLVNTLTAAEKRKEKVHILSHVPTGSSNCLHNWSNEFVRIINRFHHLISAQFNGHTHDDDTVIFYADDKKTPVNVAFNGGSLTTYSDLNPNYKLYHINPISYSVQDFESWTYNLTQANQEPQISPQWYKLYSFKDQYHVTEVTALSISNLIKEMANNSTTNLIQAYFRNKNRKADTALARGCDADCEIENLCYMVTYANGNEYHCNEITDIYNSARPQKTMT